MNWVSWIVLGFIAGTLAKWIMPGRDPGGFVATIVIGIVGGLLGGWLGTEYLKIGGPTDPFDLKSIGIALGGALFLLLIFRLCKSLRHRAK